MSSLAEVAQYGVPDSTESPCLHRQRPAWRERVTVSVEEAWSPVRDRYLTAYQLLGPRRSDTGLT